MYIGNNLSHVGFEIDEIDKLSLSETTSPLLNQQSAVLERVWTGIVDDLLTQAGREFDGRSPIDLVQTRDVYNVEHF
jgi:hypothetical protein